MACARSPPSRHDQLCGSGQTDAQHILADASATSDHEGAHAMRPYDGRFGLDSLLCPHTYGKVALGKGSERLMVRDQVLECFSGLSLDHKIAALSSLAHLLTVCSRAHYPGQEDSQDAVVRKLMTFNEIQHNVTSQLHHYVGHDSKRYPDDVFLSILFEKATAGECDNELLWAFSRVLERNLAA